MHRLPEGLAAIERLGNAGGMQGLTDTSDMSARIAVMGAVAASFDDLRLDLVGMNGRVADIAADTRWTSFAMADYERAVARWREDAASLSMRLVWAREQVQSVISEMVAQRLQQMAQPGMTVAQ